MELQKEAINFYQENGYWVSPVLFCSAELERFRAHHASVIAGNYETTRTPWGRSQPPEDPLDKLIKIDNAYWSDATLAKLVLNEKIGFIATQLAQAEGIRLWHDQLLYKPPQSEASSAVGWHQDHFYWQCAQPAHLLTAWIALVDVTEENGCMEVIPGSHQWGLLPDNDFFSQDLDGLQTKMEIHLNKKFNPVALPLKAGSVSFHHCLTIHGSRPNKSAEPRISMVVHMQPDTTYYKAKSPSDGHANVKLLSGADGDTFQGPYFPYLWKNK